MKTTAVVARTAVAELHPDSAVVLVFINQATTNTEKPEPVLAAGRRIRGAVRPPRATECHPRPTTPGGWPVFHVFAALAELIREPIVDGTHDGLAAARARGQDRAGRRR